MWRNSLQVTPTDTTPIVPELPDAKNAFGGMPLRGWEREIDQNVSAPMMIMYRGYMGKDCLTYAAMNQLLALAACTGTSQQLFVYDHSKLVRPPAAPTCRPPFRRAPSLSRPRPRHTRRIYVWRTTRRCVSTCSSHGQAQSSVYTGATVRARAPPRAAAPIGRVSPYRRVVRHRWVQSAVQTRHSTGQLIGAGHLVRIRRETEFLRQKGERTSRFSVGGNARRLMKAPPGAPRCRGRRETRDAPTRRDGRDGRARGAHR